MAIVGAGTGNDVALALRSGVVSVDAIEIDPVIQIAGAEAHPEHPYSDPRVHAVINAARSFLRGTDRHYDMVIYGLLDSHTLLSHASSVRLDSFILHGRGPSRGSVAPTVQWMISLSFTVLSSELGHKIYMMLQEAFGGRPPICARSNYDATVLLHAETSVPGLLPGDGCGRFDAFDTSCRCIFRHSEPEHSRSEAAVTRRPSEAARAGLPLDGGESAAKSEKALDFRKAICNTSCR